MTAVLERDAALADLTVLAEVLSNPRLWELIWHAIHVQAGKPVPRPEYSDDEVLPLLKACVDLSLEDKRRLNMHLETLIARLQSPPLTGGAA